MLALEGVGLIWKIHNGHLFKSSLPTVHLKQSYLPHLEARTPPNYQFAYKGSQDNLYAYERMQFK